MELLRKSRLGLLELTVVCFWVAWWFVVALRGDRQDPDWWPLLRNLGALIAALGAAGWLVRGRGAAPTLLVCAGMMILSFAVGHSLTGAIAHNLGIASVEWQLAELDLVLFGRHATEVLQPLNTPVVVEWLYANYVSFLALPVPLLVVLLVQRRFDDAYEYALAVNLSILACFVGYILLPATTPALLFEAEGAASPVQFSGPLQGLWLTPYIQTFLNEATTNRYDAFPSGHTTSTLLVLLYAFRMHRKTAWFILPTGASIIYSTLALRFHFAVDVLAGAILGATLPWMVRRAVEWWSGERRLDQQAVRAES